MDKCVSMQKRQAQYKNYTPPWKDTYRKRCQDRLKNSRDKFMDRFRDIETATSAEAAANVPKSVVEDMMREEWKIMQREQQQSVEIIKDGNSDLQEDEYWSIFEEIRAELIREEHQILMEYEAGLHHEEAMYYTSEETSNDVICPICQRNPLRLNKGVIFCSCGIRLETEQDCVTLPHIRHNLEEGIRLHDEHNAGCTGEAKFSIVDMGIQNMLMTCSVCEFMHIVV